uniref:Uncharacterized protein n=1 Tax=Panagrolaimus sp. PS1159 TaxID=55785 RepID=A0AC35GU97_9BILA
MEFKYESRELELLKLIVTMCIENLIHAGIVCTRNLQSLFYIDTEVWLKELPEDSEHKNLLDFTVTMIEGYKLLIQYGPRALFLYFSSKIVDFPAFPGTKKRAELNCHPKFVELFNAVNTDKRNENYIVFCSSPFGARAVTEFLTASRVGCIENTFNFYDLMKDKPLLRGEESFEPENAKAEFFRRPNTPVMVSTNLVENLGVIIIERTISMDYLVGGLRYTRFGRKSWCLLTEGYESIPKSMINYERRLSSTDISHNYNFNTVTSKLKIERPIKIHPIQYSVADLNVEKESNTAAATTTTKDDNGVVKNTIESVQKGEMFLKSLIGDFTMDHLDDAFNGTVEFLNEHTLKNPLWIEKYIKNENAKKNSTTFENALHSALYDPINPQHLSFALNFPAANKNSTTFENALHSALYDPINPQHISFALNLPAVQFADWEEEDDEEQEQQPKQSKPNKIKKIYSKKSLESLSPESAKPVNHYFQAIKDPKLEEIIEKMFTRRMYERQRWLCVLRDAAKAGQFLAVQKEVMEEAERLPSNFQFWDFV